MTDDTLEPELLHRFKNQLSVAIGFCELLLDECADGDPRKDDLRHIQEAILAAMAMLPELSTHMK